MTVEELIKLLQAVPEFMQKTEIAVFTDKGERSEFASRQLYIENGKLTIPVRRVN